MRIYVRAFGPLQDALGSQRLELNVPEDTCVKDAVKFLVDGWILPQRPELWDGVQNKFTFPVVLMVSHQDVQDETQILTDQQEIFLVAPMAGGSMEKGEALSSTMGAKA
jgi:molybdopterin converting factor small subunit